MQLHFSFMNLSSSRTMCHEILRDTATMKPDDHPFMKDCAIVMRKIATHRLMCMENEEESQAGLNHDMYWNKVIMPLTLQQLDAYAYMQGEHFPYKTFCAEFENQIRRSAMPRVYQAYWIQLNNSQQATRSRMTLYDQLLENEKKPRTTFIVSH